MSEVAIKVENLSKLYQLGERESYQALRDILARSMSAPLQKLFGSNGKPQKDEESSHLWALKDVSFEVKRGEVVGIIGRNGAGKSTLLKILSRITRPTSGYAEINGRVGSLLEVGTGFHPELTGRENIYLNGAVLGMRKAEIRKKFDEIVAFAEVEKFLDTPVKRYSSGMYVRLAFAVAAHLEPEILMVDEVLAVGDAQFQKKCLGKMGDVAREGRTVLFVSHNMPAVQNLCEKGFVLRDGILDFLGSTRSAIAMYLQGLETIKQLDLANRNDRKGSGWLRFKKVAAFDGAGKELQQVESGNDVYFRLYYFSEKTMVGASVLVSFNVRSSRGYLLTNLNSNDSGNSLMDIQQAGYFECFWPRFNLRAGIYDCALFCSVNGEIADWLQSAFTINAVDGDFFSTGKLISRDQGDVLVEYSWASKDGSL